MTNRRLGIIKSEPSNYKNDIFPVTGKVGMSAGAGNTRNGRRKKKNSPTPTQQPPGESKADSIGHHARAEMNGGDLLEGCTAHRPPRGLIKCGGMYGGVWGGQGVRGQDYVGVRGGDRG
uniref:Uncharacterized protein n=1 Tax=Vitis vinifera TaxID=29760 RepID=A5C7Q5_VITVI|nr:hypothetical protein VITISV_018169 [Vitis vinifera]